MYSSLVVALSNTAMLDCRSVVNRFRYIAGLLRREPLFSYPTPIPVKFQWCSLWNRSAGVCEYSNLYDHNTSTSGTYGHTDGKTTCRGNTALCVASRGKYDHTNFCISPSFIAGHVKHYKLVYYLRQELFRSVVFVRCLVRSFVHVYVP